MQETLIEEFVDPPTYFDQRDNLPKKPDDVFQYVAHTESFRLLFCELLDRKVAHVGELATSLKFDYVETLRYLLLMKDMCVTTEVFVDEEHPNSLLLAVVDRYWKLGLRSATQFRRKRWFTLAARDLGGVAHNDFFLCIKHEIEEFYPKLIHLYPTVLSEYYDIGFLKQVDRTLSRSVRSKFRESKEAGF